MSDKDHSGPAFPVATDTAAGYAAAYTGMTLRDYFAAKAMQSALNGATMPQESWPQLLPLIGKFAYEMADAMLEARQA